MPLASARKLSALQNSMPSNRAKLPQQYASAQIVPQRDRQAITLAAQSVQATAGVTALADATLQGTAEDIAGSDDETGSFILELKGNQKSKLVLNLAVSCVSLNCGLTASEIFYSGRRRYSATTRHQFSRQWSVAADTPPFGSFSGCPDIVNNANLNWDEVYLSSYETTPGNWPKYGCLRDFGTSR